MNILRLEKTMVITVIGARDAWDPEILDGLTSKSPAGYNAGDYAIRRRESHK